MQAEQPLARQLVERYLATAPAQAAQVIQAVQPAAAAALLIALTEASRARLLEALTPACLAACLDAASAEGAPVLVSSTRPDHLAHTLRLLPAAKRPELLAAVSSEHARTDVQSMLAYPDGSAASLMDGRALTTRPDASIAATIEQLGEGRAEGMDFLYVTDDAHQLVGWVRIAELLSARPQDQVADIMRPPTHVLQAGATTGMIVGHPGWEELHVLPVVQRGRFVGAIRYQAYRALMTGAREVLAEDAGSTTGAALAELYAVGFRGLVGGGSAVVGAVGSPSGSTREGSR